MGKTISMPEYEAQKSRRKKRAIKKKAWMKTERWRIKTSKEYIKMKQDKEVAWRAKQEQLRAELEATLPKEPEPDVAAVPEPPLATVEPAVDIGRWDLRVGRSIWGQLHPLSSDSHYLQHVYMGGDTLTVLISELVGHYQEDELGLDHPPIAPKGIGIVILCNHKPTRIAGMITEGRVVCAEKDGKREMLLTPRRAPADARIYVENFPLNPDQPYMKPWKNIYETVVKDLWVNEKRRVLYKGFPLKIEGQKGFIKTKTLTNCPVRIV